MDSFYLDNHQWLLRTHTSPVQIRYMQSHKPPIRIIAPGAVYRRDATDPSHASQFYQVEGLVVDHDIRLSDLKGTIEYFARSLFGADRRIRISGDHFPFTEPSIGAAVSCGLCSGAGCRSCKGGWLEILGAGMVHPQVLRNGGIDPDHYSGFAFGAGLDRLAMLKYNVGDLRLFLENDVRFLRQF
jgi:phenylalanyl-tRNA synthetase alpha chain